MRTMTFCLAAAVLLVLASSPGTEPEILDEVLADYLEDERSGRILAGIRVQLLRLGDRTRLRVTASAESPNVDPVPGYRGLRGANHITARELEKTLSSGQLRILTRHHGTGARHRGTCWPGRRGHILERRVDKTGRLLLRVPSRRDYLLEVHGCSVPLPDGEHETWLEVKGVPRLRVETVLREERGKILAVETLGGHDLRR